MSLRSRQLGAALKLLVRTAPILGVRLGLSIIFWIAMIVYWAVVIGLAALLSKIADVAGLIVFLVALGGNYYLFVLARRYVFYLVKAAHIAVVSELLTSGSLPAGQGQLAWGKRQVQDRFGQVSIMFAVDQIVNGVIGVFTRLVWSIGSLLPGDLRQLVGLVNRVIRYATSYIDEAVLARAFWRREQNVWESARDGIVLYGQVWKPLLANAIALMVLSYVPFILALIVLAAPVGLLLGLFSAKLAAWSVLLLIILAYLVKVAVGDSFAMIAMILAYHQETAQLTPDPAMEAQLEQVSDRFRQLKARIVAPPVMPQARPAI
jgi:hypothetical protein